MTITQKEMASLGGKARAKKLSPERKKEISKLANEAKREKGLSTAHDVDNLASKV